MSGTQREITFRFLAEPGDVNFGGQVHGGNSGTGSSAPNNAGDTGKTGTFRTVTANITVKAG